MVIVLKNSPANTGDIENAGSVPGLGRSPHSSTLPWRNPLTEKPGRLQSMGSQRVGHTEAT